MPRPKLIYQGDGEYAPPVADWRTCPHPRNRLRFDPRYSMPIWTYCRDYGATRIHPHHGLTDEQVEEAQRRATELAYEMNKEMVTRIPVLELERLRRIEHTAEALVALTRGIPLDFDPVPCEMPDCQNQTVEPTNHPETGVPVCPTCATRLAYELGRSDEAAGIPRSPTWYLLR